MAAAHAAAASRRAPAAPQSRCLRRRRARAPGAPRRRRRPRLRCPRRLRCCRRRCATPGPARRQRCELRLWRAPKRQARAARTSLPEDASAAAASEPFAPPPGATCLRFGGIGSAGDVSMCHVSTRLSVVATGLPICLLRECPFAFSVSARLRLHGARAAGCGLAARAHRVARRGGPVLPGAAYGGGRGVDRGAHPRLLPGGRRGCVCCCCACGGCAGALARCAQHAPASASFAQALQSRLPRRQRTPRLTPPVRAGAAQVPAARRERVCALVPGAGAVRGAARRHQHVA